MNQLRLEWVRYPDGFVAAVAAYGLTSGQLRHYAGQVRIRDYSTNESRPMLLATWEQHDDLLCLLESQGYEIESDEILMQGDPV
jgi:hypothetical protein